MSFRLLSAGHDDRRVPLWFPNTLTDEITSNICTIIIGKNGSGKSRLLSNICTSFINIDAQFDKKESRSYDKGRVSKSANVQLQFHLSYLTNSNLVDVVFDRNHVVQSRINGNVNTELSIKPARVIATTTTPFDKFPIGNKRIDYLEKDNAEEQTQIYRYLGSKNNIGQISNTGQISRVIESLIVANSKSRRDLARISRVFEFLGYIPRVEAEYELRAAKRLLIDFKNGTVRVEDLLDRLTNISLSSVRRASLENRMQKDLAFTDTLYQSLNTVAAIYSEQKTITIEVDFRTPLSDSENIDVFRSLQFLRTIGLVGFSDLKLFKNNSAVEAISITDASSGEQGIVLTLLGVASEIEDNSLIIIDEPEIGLHPEWQEKFIPLMDSVFGGYSGCHFLLATHSPQVISSVGNLRCAVITIDDLGITDVLELSKKSVDYQLAEVFDTPGYRNEYLAREALSALRLVSRMEHSTKDFKDKLELLARARPHLQDDDPVAQMTDAIVQSVSEISK